MGILKLWIAVLIKCILCIVILSCAAFFVWGNPGTGIDPEQEGEDSSFSLSLMSGARIPLHTYSDIFNTGGGIMLHLSYSIPSFPLFLRGSVMYDFIPVNGDLNISILSLGISSGTLFDPHTRITIAPSLGGGFFYSFLNNNLIYNGAHPYGIIGITTEFSLSNQLSLGFDTGYRHYFGFHDDFYFSINGTIHIPIKTNKQIDSSILNIDNIYPILYDYYEKNPIGSLSITNISRNPITVSKMSFFIKDYVEEPRETILDTVIKGNGNLDINVFADFNRKILDITTLTRAMAIIRLEYQSRGKMIRRELKQPVTFYSRNMIEKDNPGHISAFITHNDPDIERCIESLAKVISGYTHVDMMPNLFIAIGVYNLVRTYGINVMDNPGAVDDHEIIKLPGATLKEKQGNDKDIAVLFCSLFKSLNIEAALIFTPDITFFAFALNTSPGSMKEDYLNSDDCIIYDDSLWLPLIFTDKANDFYQAVEQGLLKWKKYNKNNDAILYPVYVLHNTFKGLDLAHTTHDFSMEEIQEDVLYQYYKEDVDNYYVQAGTPVSWLHDSGRESGKENIRSKNNIAIVYAKYTMYDKAIFVLQDILLYEDYIPALINLGNVYYILGEMKKASSFYERAYEKDPIHPVILLKLARAHFALENYGNVREYYRKLHSIDPELALEFQYLQFSKENAEMYKEEINKMIWMEYRRNK